MIINNELYKLALVLLVSNALVYATEQHTGNRVEVVGFVQGKSEKIDSNTALNLKI